MSKQWASDDAADDLLAGILDETALDAQAEEERIQAEIRKREEEEARKRQEEQDRKRLDAEARISAEQERQNEVKERRTQRMQALKIEDLKERGEWIDPEIAAAKERAAEAARLKAEEDAARHAAQLERARQEVAPMPGQAAAPAKSNTGLFIGLAAVVAAVIIAGVAIGVLAGGGYEVDAQQYSKAVYSPKDVQVALVEKGITPLPKAEPAVAPAEEPRTTRRSSRRSSRKSSAKSKKSKGIVSKKSTKIGTSGKKKVNKLEKMLNSNNDPFGGF